METQATSTKKARPIKPLLMVGGAIIVCGLSFYSGVAFQKSKSPNTTLASNNTPDGNMRSGFENGPRMSPSTVTAISSTSVTVKTSSGDSKTYTISGSTSIVKDQGAITTADITAGDTVLVISEDGTNATRIIVNPPQNGGPIMYNGGNDTYAN